MTELTQPIERLELEKDLGKSPLLLFIFITHPPEIQLKNAKGILVMAYRLEDAMTRAGFEVQQTKEIKDWSLFFTGQKIPMTGFIEKLYIDNIVSPPATEAQIIEPPSGAEITKQNFIWNLLLAMDKWVENKEDKDKLKDILKKIK